MRLFIAINLSDAMKDSLINTQNALYDLGVRGKYTSEENLHLTLAFIGEYPNAEPVLDVRDSVPLTAVVHRIRRTLAESGIPFDRKRFSPHVTLIRKASGEMPGIAPVPVSMTVNTIFLMRSDRGRNGMIYTELGRMEAE